MVQKRQQREEHGADDEKYEAEHKQVTEWRSEPRANQVGIPTSAPGPIAALRASNSTMRRPSRAVSIAWWSAFVVGAMMTFAFLFFKDFL